MTLASGKVLVDLHRFTGDLHAEGCLSEPERTKAAAFRFEKDRSRYVESHGRLRHRLSQLLGRAPEAIALSTGTHGKPYLAGFPIHFNLSHAGSYYAAAFSRDHPVGIDVEVLPDRCTLSDLIDHICHPDERQSLEALATTGEREQRLLFWWTAKEALLKALGVGLHIEPSRIHVMGEPGQTQGHFASDSVEAQAEAWQWHLLVDAADHKLTVVVPKSLATTIVFPGFPQSPA